MSLSAESPPAAKGWQMLSSVLSVRFVESSEADQRHQQRERIEGVGTIGLYESCSVPPVFHDFGKDLTADPRPPLELCAKERSTVHPHQSSGAHVPDNSVILDRPVNRSSLSSLAGSLAKRGNCPVFPNFAGHCRFVPSSSEDRIPRVLCFDAFSSNGGPTL